METPLYATLLRLHLVFGSLSLVTFWWQMAARKRGPRHRRVGQAYFLSMAGVAVTAVPMTVLIGLDGRWATALFLGFLAWITISAGVSAWAAARWRQRHLDAQRRFDLVSQWGLLAISITLLALVPVGGVLFAGLGAFGLWAVVTERRRPADDLAWRSWKVRHISAVMGTGMAVHVAFLSFGLGRLLGDGYQAYFFLIAFALPVLLGNWAVARFTRPYRQSPGGAGAGAAPAVPSG